MQLGLSEEAYLEYASELSLNLDQFSDCIAEDRYLASVQDEFDWAAQLGVRSTPTFFINGIPLVGAQPYSIFVQVIEDELAGNNN
jgi:predicted DsbA family dithiol-disulfide isomerase